MKRLIVLPPIIQVATVVLLWRRSPYAMHAQLSSVALMTIVVCGVAIRRVRELREIRARQRAQAEAFRGFVRENSGSQGS